MVRSVLVSVLLFLLPFALYFLRLGLQRRQADEEIPAEAKQLAWIAGAGLLLAFLGFLYFTDFRAAPPDSVYIPPHLENGKLVPGHFAPRTPAP